MTTSGLLKAVEGRKTHAAAAVLALAGVLFAVGVLTPGQFQALSAAAVSLGVYGLREALTRLRETPPSPPVALPAAPPSASIPEPWIYTPEARRPE